MHPPHPLPPPLNRTEVWFRTIYPRLRCAFPHCPPPPLLPPPIPQAGIKSAAHEALKFHSQDKGNGRRSQIFNSSVPVNRVDFDETWVPLMTLTAEECKEQVLVKVDNLAGTNLESSLSDLAFTDVAPKAFLQIRHAAGVSSREYADTLGKALAAATVALLQRNNA